MCVFEGGSGLCAVQPITWLWGVCGLPAWIRHHFQVGYVPILPFLRVLSLQLGSIRRTILLEIRCAIVGGTNSWSVLRRSWGFGSSEIQLRSVSFLWWGGTYIVGIDGYRAEYRGCSGRIAFISEVQGHQIGDCGDLAPATGQRLPQLNRLRPKPSKRLPRPQPLSSEHPPLTQHLRL